MSAAKSEDETPPATWSLMNTPIISVRDVHKPYGPVLPSSGRTAHTAAHRGRSAMTRVRVRQILVLSRPRPRFRVLICDDDEVYRIGLCTVLRLLPQIEIVGEAAEPARALELSEVFAPHIALVSSEFGDAALLLVEALNREGVRVVMVGPQSASETGPTKHTEADAHGYLPREASSANALECVRAALPSARAEQ
ncbi:hypothetical protein ACPW96_00100 [Micromonospora sp. DT81.3]|uniref:hypothetical protein n=1 Tax=Micromonospora sp. DT81.3 TaxID=3416523 RepID=UPI003CF276AA